MELEAICIQQGNPNIHQTRPTVKEGYSASIYLTAMCIEDLAKLARLDRAPAGYQREPERKRWTKKGTGLFDYMENQEGILPTSVVVNVRNPEDISFNVTKDLGYYKVGILKISDNIELQLIDGQHRVFGLRDLSSRKAEIKNFALPVSILVLPNPFNDIVFEEMRQFYIVNKRAKPVPTDVAFENLARMYERLGLSTLAEIEGIIQARRGKAMGIVKILAEKDPWHERIKLVGVPSPHAVIPAKTMADAIARWVLRETVFDMMSEETLANLLTEFWTAIAELYEPAFKDPKSYTLQDYTGVHALTMTFPIVYEHCRNKYNVVGKDHIKEILKLIASLVPVDCWNRRRSSKPEFLDIHLSEIRRIANAFKDIILGRKSEYELPPK